MVIRCGNKLRISKEEETDLRVRAAQLGRTIPPIRSLADYELAVAKATDPATADVINGIFDGILAGSGRKNRTGD